MIRFQIPLKWQILLFWIASLVIVVWATAYHREWFWRISAILVTIDVVFHLLRALWDIIYEHF